ncbi:hypothetical protein [Desulfitobacterium sp.]|uniref:hypothetical protein n=1 Tax=Desulfitobacterium sp. TaxID=49981 RepID=UPI002B1F2D62|nr:hypothetical protein [Desulfitobacterium sp.]MEA4902082.1 hypothetical protein [Desulfitobacterium sp.]
MTKEDEILEFLEVRMFKPILNSSTTSERFKGATRGLKIRLKQRDAQGMIEYFWRNVVDATAKHANYGRMLQNEKIADFENVVDDFRVRFKEL